MEASKEMKKTAIILALALALSGCKTLDFITRQIDKWAWDGDPPPELYENNQTDGESE